MMIKTLDNVYINMEDFSGFTEEKNVKGKRKFCRKISFRICRP